MVPAGLSSLRGGSGLFTDAISRAVVSSIARALTFRGPVELSRQSEFAATQS
jgi:hypothetical protein